MKGWLMIVFAMLLNYVIGLSQGTDVIKVHFLYGSKPKKQHRETEGKWFGGRLGGHVGIEVGEDSILNFLPMGKFHWIGKRHDRHSQFRIHSNVNFYKIFATPGPVKKAVVYIPVSTQQRKILDSVSSEYLSKTPYDYAFLGMRCGAASYDILGQIGVVKEHGRRSTSVRIFYPRKLRRKVFHLASKHEWKVELEKGSGRRKWERDAGRNAKKYQELQPTKNIKALL
jgi:hypothetical protein